MFCTNCGSDLPSGKCPVCGASPTLSSGGRDDVISGLELAGFWRRAGSRIADDLLLIIPGALVVAIAHSVANLAVGWVAFFALNGIYVVTFFSGPRGQTLGGRLANTSVRDADGALRLTVTQACKRWGFVAAYGALELAGHGWILVVLAISLIDNLYLLVDYRRQTLHDKFAHTIVVLA